MATAVDVVVPTRNTRDLTLRCVDALMRQGLACDLHCVVVDNASADGTAAAVTARYPSATVIVEPVDRGYGTACNTGAQHGTAPFVLILNSDAFARPGALAQLVRFLEEHTDFVLAAGQLVDVGTDSPQVGFAIRGFPTLANQVALLLGLERFWPRNPISRKQLMLDFDYARTQELSAQPAGACLLVRRVDFEEIGGFEERFFYWFEDVDLVQRLRARGKLAYVHDAVFDHVGGASFARWTRPALIAARYDGLLRYFSVHRPLVERRALRVVVGVLASTRALFYVATDQQRAVAHAKVLLRALKRS